MTTKMRDGTEVSVTSNENPDLARAIEERMGDVQPRLWSITVRARTAAIAWLNAFLATSTEESRPVLNQTLSLEVFEGGLQVVCTNGHALVRTWVEAVAVPIDPDESTIQRAATQRHQDRIREWPLLEETPDHAVIVMDRDGFGKSFMTTLLAVTGDEEHEFDELTLSVEPRDEGANLALGEQFMSRRLSLRACGQRMDLLLMQGVYPSWRHLRLGLEERAVDGLVIAPKLLQMLGKFREVTGVELEFHGSDERYVSFAAQPKGGPKGLVMPMRRHEGESKGDA